MIIRIFAILLILSATLFGADTAYAWGYGDLMIETLKVVKYIFSVNEFQDVWKLAMIISMTVTTIAMMTPQTDFLKLPKVIIMSTGVWTIFTVNTIDIYVDDKADNSKSGLVTQVPWAVGYPVSLFTTLEYRLGDMYETATSIPSGMKYSDSGFFTPISIFSQATQHKIVNPNLYQNLNNYIQDCVIPDLENGYKDYIVLSQSDNIWSYMSNTSPATFVMWMNTDNTTELKICTQFYTDLNGMLISYASSTGQGMSYLGKTLGISSAATISSMLGVSNQFLTNSSKTASQMLLQNTALNTFNDSFKSYVAVNNGDLNSAALHSASAESQAQAQMIISGVLGSKYIPIIKGILTVVVLGLTPILALMMITPIGMKTLLGYIMMLFWLSCWHFGDAILNHIIVTKAQSAMSSYGDTTMATKGLIDASVTDYINMASSMYWTIPTIALVIATGFSLTALTSLNSTLTGGLNRTATASGAELGKGNVNYGSISHDNYNANKSNSTNAFDIGTMGAMNNGAFNYKSQLGSTSGTSSSNPNEHKGNMGMNTNIGNDSVFSKAVMNGGGQSYSFDKFDGSLSSTGGSTSEGRSLFKGSGVATNSKGQSANVENDSLFTKNNDGSYSLYQGKMSGISGKDMGGNSLSTSIEMNQGKEIGRTVTDAQGDTATVKTMEDGRKLVNYKSGQDSGTTASAIFNPKANQWENVTDGDIKGIDFSQAKSGKVSVGSSTANKMLESLGSSKTSGFSSSSKSGESLSSKESSSGNVGLGAGIGKSGAATGLSYSKDGTATFSFDNGESKSIQMSGEERKAFESSLARNMTDEESKSISRNMESSVIANKLNQGYAKGQTMDEIFGSKDGIVQNKDNLFNETKGNTSVGAESNYKGGDNQGISKNNVNYKNANSYNENDWKDGQDKHDRSKITAANKSSEMVGMTNDDGSIRDDKKDDYADLVKRSDEKLKNSKSIDGYGMDAASNTAKTIEAKAKESVDVSRTDKMSGDKFEKLQESGVVEKALNGKTDIVKDWDQVKNMSKEDILKMKNTGNFDKGTKEKLDDIAKKNGVNEFITGSNDEEKSRMAAVGTLAATAATIAGVGASVKYGPKMKDAVVDKLKDLKGDEFTKSAIELDKNMNVVDKAIKTGKGGTGTKEAFANLGLDKYAEKNGFVFNKDGSIDEKSTFNKQSEVRAKGNLDKTLNERLDNMSQNENPNKVGRDMFSDSINQRISESSDPKEIQKLEQLKKDVESGKEISNKRMVSNGFNQSLSVNEPISIGSTVQTADRGNFGTVTGINKDGSMQVHFINPETKKEATINYSEDKLKNVKAGALDGNFNFDNVGKNYVNSNSELHSTPKGNIHKIDTPQPGSGSMIGNAAKVAGAVALGSVISANASEDTNKLIEAGANLLSGYGAAIIPTSFGKDSELTYNENVNSSVNTQSRGHNEGGNNGIPKHDDGFFNYTENYNSKMIRDNQDGQNPQNENVTAQPKGHNEGATQTQAKVKSDGDFNITKNYDSETFKIMDINKGKGNPQPVPEIKEK